MLTEKFHFLIYQSIEFFVINLNLNSILSNFKLPSLLSNIITWCFYGISFQEINYLDWLNNYKLIYASIGLLCFLILYIIIDFIKNRQNKNYRKIILKFGLLSLFPFVNLAISDIILLEKQHFIISFMAILILSTFVIALPASIFNILYGQNRFFLRKEFFFLLDPFTKSYKYISLIYILKQILTSPGIIFYNIHPIMMNSYLLIINLGFLSLNLIFFNKAYENFSFLIRNSIFEISLSIINFFLIVFDNSIIKIVFSSLYFVSFIIYLLLNLIFRQKKLKKKNSRKLSFELSSSDFLDFSEKVEFREMDLIV